jgi:hypothetical protein
VPHRFQNVVAFHRMFPAQSRPQLAEFACAIIVSV